jgi:hypothetical protein
VLGFFAGFQKQLDELHQNPCGGFYQDPTNLAEFGKNNISMLNAPCFGSFLLLHFKEELKRAKLEENPKPDFINDPHTTLSAVTAPLCSKLLPPSQPSLF